MLLSQVPVLLSSHWELLQQLHFYFHAVLPTSQPEVAKLCKKNLPCKQTRASFPGCLLTLNDIEITGPGTALWPLSSCDLEGAEGDAELKGIPARLSGIKERDQLALIKSIFLKRSPHAKIWFKEH